MRKFNLLWVVVALCLLVVPGPASATWEFSMTGSWYWTYYWGAQLGDEGFFGTYDRSDLGTLGGGPVGNLTNANFWAGRNDLGSLGVQGRSFGVAGQTDLKTGHDASLQTMWMDIYPEIRFNQAVRVRGIYHIGEWGTQFDSQNPNSQNAGMQNAFSEGQWYMLWLTAQTPMGIITIGKRPSMFGLGTRNDGTYVRQSDSLSLTSEYGPLRIGVSGYPWRSGTIFVGDLADKSGVRPMDATALVTYRAGVVDMGAYARWVQIWSSDERAVTAAGVASLTARRADNSIIRTDWEGVYYFKYFNGRFFFNSELSHMFKRFTRQQSMDQTPGAAASLRAGGFGSSLAPTYVDEWKALVIAGTVCGPVKVSGLWFWHGPGLDRRAGLVIDNQGFDFAAAGTPTEGFHNVVFQPYSWLMGWQYGGGNNGFNVNNSQDGSLYDASVYAARVDYAVAANLNTWVSFLWADRNSKSYPWGYVSVTANYNTAYSTTPAGAAARGPTAVPSIPDSNLGWEADFGVDWRLLEGFRVSGLFAYWDPGKWFNYACVDLGVPNWNVPTAGNNWGVNPGRKIDPVVGGYVSLIGEF
ncbi:MAG: hypothetical protein AB1473_22840 [Thermodesulfobacteriota bacterium]